MDYRYLVRQFELERMLTDADRERRSFGARYVEPLLAVVFSSIAENLEVHYPELPESHKLLYAVNAFAYQLSGGGFGEFRVETGAPLCLLETIQPSLSKIGAADFASALPSATSHGGRALIGRMCEMQRSTTPEALRQLDELTRRYIHQHQGQYFIVCDGNAGLEIDWTKSRLEQFTWNARHFGRDGQVYLFEPTIRQSVSSLGQKKLGRLVRSCRALVDNARKFGNGTEFDVSQNSILIRAEETNDIISDVTLKYFEDHQVEMRWGIFSWTAM